MAALFARVIEGRSRRAALLCALSRAASEAAPTEEFADGSIWQRKDWNFAEVRLSYARAVADDQPLILFVTMQRTTKRGESCTLIGRERAIRELQMSVV